MVGPAAPAYTVFVGGQYACSLINSNVEYWMPGSASWTFADGSGGYVPSRMDGMLMHELLHNLGATDGQIQTALFGKTDPLTDNISQQLTKDCFPTP